MASPCMPVDQPPGEHMKKRESRENTCFSLSCRTLKVQFKRRMCTEFAKHWGSGGSSAPRVKFGKIIPHWRNDMIYAVKRRRRKQLYIGSMEAMGSTTQMLQSVANTFMIAQIAMLIETACNLCSYILQNVNSDQNSLEYHENLRMTRLDIRMPHGPNSSIGGFRKTPFKLFPTLLTLI